MSIKTLNEAYERRLAETWTRDGNPIILGYFPEGGPHDRPMNQNEDFGHSMESWRPAADEISLQWWERQELKG